MKIKIAKTAQREIGKEKILEWIRFTSKGFGKPRAMLVYVCMSRFSNKAHWKPYEKVLYVTLRKPCGPFRSLFGYNTKRCPRFPLFNAEEQNIATLAHEFAHVKQHWKQFGDLRYYRTESMRRQHIFSESQADKRALKLLTKWRETHPTIEPISLNTGPMPSDLTGE